MSPLQQSLDIDLGTAAPLVRPKVDMPTRMMALENTARADLLVTQVTTLTSDVLETHAQALTQEWSVLTSHRATYSVRSLLDLLADQGFAWRDIARMIGVSVPALQKWRKGVNASGENRFRLASLVAAQDLISSQGRIEEIVSWFETPIMDAVPVTPIDLWANGQPLLVLQYAARRLRPDDVLTRFDPSWRTTYESAFETFRGEDGQMSIRLKG